MFGPAAASSGRRRDRQQRHHLYQQRELNQGDVIACGTTDIEGYGTTPLDRAQFIIDTIRTHLARQACTRTSDDLSSIHALLGTAVRWCPACGTRLPVPSQRVTNDDG